MFQATILSSDYIIKTVRYDSGSVSLFDEPELYSFISRSLQGRNYHMIKIFWQRALFSEINQEFPMVESIDLFFLEKNTAAVSLQFYDPIMVLIVDENKFAVYDALHIVPLYKHNTLWQDVLHVNLANYISDVYDLDGIFFKIDPLLLYEQIMLLDEYLQKPYELLYFPGAEKSRITAADWKILYFNHLGSIPNQLRKIDMLKKYYSDFDNLRQMDLWSLDDHTVIVRK